MFSPGEAEVELKNFHDGATRLEGDNKFTTF